jgi:ornithine decarboxylase
MGRHDLIVDGAGGGGLRAAAVALPDAVARMKAFLDRRRPASPCLVIDLDVVAENYDRLRRTFPDARIYYAVKANPEPAVLRQLVRLGASFDVASRGEIDLCLDAGADPADLSYGNTIKKADDIEYARSVGIDLFAFDSGGELEKLAELAPGASVFCRLLVSSDGACWPLGNKFGCTPEMAVDLMARASTRGLVPYGVSFHVGSQQLEPARWATAIEQAAQVCRILRHRGIAPRLLNIGGGFPANYVGDIPPLSAYGDAIYGALERHFAPGARPSLAMEPGRSVAGDAGLLRTTVVLVSQKSYDASRRWVYLDAGRFGGLAETEGEAIRYRIATGHDPGPTGPVVLAGPTCDSADVLYQENAYRLSLDLRPGDHVDVLSAGAYTRSYSSVEFNGFEPLRIYCIGGSP